MGRKVILIVALIVGSIAGVPMGAGAAPPVAGTPQASPAAPALAGTLDQARAEIGIPGLTAAVFRCDGVLEAAASGVRRLDSPDPVTLDDPFHIGSNVKAMTTTMIATLVEEGALAWTTRPLELFPELEGSINPVFRVVTLEQVLSHHAGLPAWEDLEGMPTFEGSGVEQRRAAVPVILEGEPGGAVGDYLYSNAGYVLAAAMAETVTGQSWEELIADRLLTPLGIEATPGWPVGADAPWGHAVIDGELMAVDPAGPYQIPAFLTPAGNLSVSLTDYLVFGQLHLCGLRDRPRLIAAETFARLHTSLGPAGEEGEGYALGWLQVAAGDAILTAHEGSAGTFTAVIILDPARDLGVIVLANEGEESAGGMVPDIGLAALSPYWPE